MKVLLLSPKTPSSFWSFKYALKFVSKKAVNPPLGLLTVASLLPGEWEKKLVDLNTSGLNIKDIKWADMVFISAMSVQQESVTDIINLCKNYKKKIVAGGPLFMAESERFDMVDHLILGEAEITLPQFLDDLQKHVAKSIYTTTEFAEIKESPVPDYSLLKISNYNSLTIQYSRGCPFDCEFCDITALYGRKVRTKSHFQIIQELDNLYLQGWRGNVFFVDDNMIGNKRHLKSILLPAIIEWMKAHNYPFFFMTEASINMADDRELLDLMVQAGFASVFIGIESPSEASLAECNKVQNTTRNLLDSVKTIQNSGIEVSAGFIVGFDNDTPSVFQRQIDFIQRSGIITAMVGLLNAPRKTKLYQRLQGEGRIRTNWTGSNTDYSLNFLPKMKLTDLLDGYQRVIQGIYSAKAYYKRVKLFLLDFNPKLSLRTDFSLIKIIAFIKSMFILGIFNHNRKYYWNLIFWCLLHKPKVFPLAVTYSIYGYHFRKVYKGIT